MNPKSHPQSGSSNSPEPTSRPPSPPTDPKSWTPPSESPSFTLMEPIIYLGPSPPLSSQVTVRSTRTLIPSGSGNIPWITLITAWRLTLPRELAGIVQLFPLSEREQLIDLLGKWLASPVIV